MRVPRRVIGAFLLFAIVGCGSDSGSTNPLTGGHTGTITATIDGNSWSSSIDPIAFSKGDSLQVGGANATAGLSVVVLTAGMGPFVLQSGPSAVGIGGIVDSNGEWTTQDGAVGTLTFTTRTATHATGTFQFDAVPSGMGATGTRHITNGHFDVVVSPQ